MEEWVCSNLKTKNQWKDYRPQINLSRFKVWHQLPIGTQILVGVSFELLKAYSLPISSNPLYTTLHYMVKKIQNAYVNILFFSNFSELVQGIPIYLVLDRTQINELWSGRLMLKYKFSEPFINKNILLISVYSLNSSYDIFQDSSVWTNLMGSGTDF